MKLRPLVDHFIEHGWVRLEGAFDAKAAAHRAARALERYHALPPRPVPHKEARPIGVTLPATESFPLGELAPAALSLVEKLAGGSACLREKEITLSDSFVVAPPGEKRWRAPNVYDFGWHIDGTCDEKRTIDTPEIGLIVYSLWSDVEPKGGGTFFAPGALPLLARHLYDRPHGVPKEDLPYELCLLAAEDPGFFEFTGPAGSVLITHPLMIHAASLNASSRPRLLNVRTIPLAAPLRVSGRRPRPTPIELATDEAIDKAAPPRRR